MTTTGRQQPFILLVVVLGFIGCAQSPIAKTDLAPVICPATEQARAFAAALDVVRHMHFGIDKADPRAGYIKTLPLSGAQAFELWRSDNAGMFNTLEANLHSIRRIAELQITQHDENIHVNCVVLTQRLNLPGREVSSSARAYQIHSQGSAAIPRLKLAPDQARDMVWTDLDADQHLAQRILDRIRRRLSGPDIPLDSQT